MEKMGAQLDDEPWPHRLRLPGDLDGEVLGFNQERVATTAIPFGFDLCAQPLRTMDRVTVLSVFRCLFRLSELP